MAVWALDTIKSLLDRRSAILFKNPGLGLVEKVNEKFFPDPEDRPHWVALALVPPYTKSSVEASQKVSVGDAPSARYLLRTLIAVGLPCPGKIQDDPR